MEPTQTASIINYFENVLGIRKILFSPDAFTNSAQPVVFIENFNSYTSVEIELTKKILAAVSLDISQIEIKSDRAPADVFMLTFKDEPSSELEIYSPRTLQVKPELKKLAWDKLKSLG